jgi:hypothetical protein
MRSVLTKALTFTASAEGARANVVAASISFPAIGNVPGLNNVWVSVLSSGNNDQGLFIQSGQDALNDTSVEFNFEITNIAVSDFDEHQPLRQYLSSLPVGFNVHHLVNPENDSFVRTGSGNLQVKTELTKILQYHNIEEVKTASVFNTLGIMMAYLTSVLSFCAVLLNAWELRFADDPFELVSNVHVPTSDGLQLGEMILRSSSLQNQPELSGGEGTAEGYRGLLSD